MGVTQSMEFGQSHDEDISFSDSAEDSLATSNEGQVEPTTTKESFKAVVNYSAFEVRNTFKPRYPLSDSRPANY